MVEVIRILLLYYGGMTGCILQRIFPQHFHVHIAQPTSYTYELLTVI